MTARPSRWITLAAGSALVVSLDTMVNIAFPAITARFDLGVERISWVVVCYLLTYASLLLATGRLADVFGHRRVLLAGLVGTVAGVTWCGLAPTFGWFLAGRVVQGVGAALVLGSAPALVTLAVGETERSRALGTYQLGVSAGLALGPPIGGVLVAVGDWRWVYLVRAPLAGLLALAVVVGTPSVATPDRSTRRSFDLAGVSGLGVAAAAALFALSRARTAGWSDTVVVGCVVAAVVVTVAWVLHERRTAEPVMDPLLLRHRPFALANLLTLLANGTMFAVWLLVPYFLVSIRGHHVVVGGLLLACTPAATAFSAPLAARLEARVGAGALCSIGLAVQAAGLVVVAFLDATSPVPFVVVGLALIGLGLGLFTVPNLSYVMGSIPRDAQGVAGGLAQMMRTVGITAGVTLTGQFFAARRGGATDDASFVGAFGDAFLAVGAVCAVVVVLSLLRPAPPQVRSASA